MQECFNERLARERAVTSTQREIRPEAQDDTMNEFTRRLLAHLAWSEESRVPIDGCDILELMIDCGVLSKGDVFAAFRKAEDQISRLETSADRRSIDPNLQNAKDNATVGIDKEHP